VATKNHQLFFRFHSRTHLKRIQPMKKKTTITTEMYEVWVIRQPWESEMPEADLRPSPPIQESLSEIRNCEEEDLPTDQEN